MPATRQRRTPAAPSWVPTRPVPWPDTGEPHLDLFRAAVEQRLYPYGDLESSPGRSTSSYQLSLLAKGRAAGMSDSDVANFLSANLMCGGTPVYRRTADGIPQSAGYVVFSGRCGAADVMGRRPFIWHLSLAPGGAVATVELESVVLYDAFRRAFDVPERETHPSETAAPAWDDVQGVLF